jgi:L-histidine N-alpha-methyltransferase
MIDALQVQSDSEQRLHLLQAPRRQVSDGLAAAVRHGLRARQKHLPCRYLYDAVGSALFESICEQPEYYVTRAELQALESHARAIVDRAGAPSLLVELGSGSAKKTRRLVEALLGRRATLRYVPIDISPTILVESARALLDNYPSLRITALAVEYEEGMRWLRHTLDEPALVAWLGSNLGNLTRPAAARFLRRLGRLLLPTSRLLIGIDLRKDRQTLERAYADAAGVTARFNLNLLARLNRELGAHFNLACFHHLARYDELSGCVELYLVSERRQRVRIDALGLEVVFDAGEWIHTESSHKYSREEIALLARAADLTIEDSWLDVSGRFQLVLFRRLPSVGT